MTSSDPTGGPAPFRPEDLYVLAYANGFTLWHYRMDRPSQIDADFFDANEPMVRPGDVVWVSGDGSEEARQITIRTNGGGRD